MPYAPPQSEYESFDPNTQDRWEYGTVFDAYDLGEGPSSAQDELEGRVADAQSQWRTPRLSGMRSDNIGSKLIAAVVVLRFTGITRKEY